MASRINFETYVQNKVRKGITLLWHLELWGTQNTDFLNMDQTIGVHSNKHVCITMTYLSN